jgi:hypothetical protein
LVKVREFEFVKSPEKQVVGFIAQELAEVFPEAVVRGDDNSEVIEKQWMVDASKLIPAMLLEIQSLRKRIKDIEDESN